MNINNIIKFWKCLSWSNWVLHKAIDKETKKFHSILLFLWKTFWDFSKKNECDLLINQWKMTFQALDDKGYLFLELVDDKNNPLEASYVKGRIWLKHFSHSNLVYIRALRAIINHALIGEYYLRFFSNKTFYCPCGFYPIKTRHHILHNYKHFNNYWNLRRDSISYFILFLEFNSSAFPFPFWNNTIELLMTNAC